MTRSRRHDRLERLVETATSERRHWTDAPGDDPSIALVELFAFLGDTLSSYADAIADESFLGSRRRNVDVQVTIDGEFGDGVHGRRLPVGGEVRVSYRSGRRYSSVTLQEGRVVLNSDSPAAGFLHGACTSHEPVHHVAGIAIDAADQRGRERVLERQSDEGETWLGRDHATVADRPAIGTDDRQPDPGILVP